MNTPLVSFKRHGDTDVHINPECIVAIEVSDCKSKSTIQVVGKHYEVIGDAFALLTNVEALLVKTITRIAQEVLRNERDAASAEAAK